MFCIHIVIGSEPIENSEVFRNKEARSVLGCALIFPAKYHKHPVFIDFISRVLNHDARFAIDCVRKVFRADPSIIPPDIKKISFWTDCGLHFRCAEFLTFTMVDLPNEIDVDEITLNFRAEQHGKSIVDSHFSAVSKYMDNASRYSSPRTCDDLCKTLQFEQSQSNQIRQQNGLFLLLAMMFVGLR